MISNFKKTEFLEIRDFISKHKDYLQFPYSPAHFNDLKKSFNSENDNFYTDLNNLEFLSEKHLIRWGAKGIEPLFATPKEYFETEKDSEDIFSIMDLEKLFSELDENDFGFGKFGTIMKSLYQLQSVGIPINDENKEILNKMFPNLNNNSTMWDFMKEMTPFSKNLLQNRDYYKDFRKTIGDKGFKLEANSGNWSENEVIEKIDSFLKKQNTNLTFIEYVNLIFKHRKEQVSRFEFFTTAYLLLDMIGYKPDKLRKPTDNMQNIQNDAEHSFYAAYCDYFVVIDKILRTKTKVLYNKFNIPTIVLTPDELIQNLIDVIHKLDDNSNFIEQVFSFCKNENIVETYPKNDENEIETYAFKLPFFYFNFFNYVVYQNYEKQNGIIFTFKKVFKNYSNFIYYTETERLIDRICNYFGYDNLEELKVKKQEFTYENKNIELTWQFSGGLIKLEKDDETKRPILTYILMINNNIQ